MEKSISNFEHKKISCCFSARGMSPSSHRSIATTWISCGLNACVEDNGIPFSLAINCFDLCSVGVLSGGLFLMHILMRFRGNSRSWVSNGGLSSLSLSTMAKSIRFISGRHFSKLLTFGSIPWDWQLIWLVAHRRLSTQRHFSGAWSVTVNVGIMHDRTIAAQLLFFERYFSVVKMFIVASTNGSFLPTWA